MADVVLYNGSQNTDQLTRGIVTRTYQNVNYTKYFYRYLFLPYTELPNLALETPNPSPRNTHPVEDVLTMSHHCLIGSAYVYDPPLPLFLPATTALGWAMSRIKCL